MSRLFSSQLRGVCVALVATMGLFLIQTPQVVGGRSIPIGTNGQGAVFVVGDSLTVGTEAFGKLSTKIDTLGVWTNVVLDAKVGRKASVGASVIDKGIKRSTTALVIALGTNDMISKPETWYPRWVIDAVMQKTRGLPVLWVNLEFSQTGRADWRARGVRFNKELRLAKLRYPNLTIADWNTAFTPLSKSRFIEDGVHLTVSGYKTRSTILFRFISTFGESIVNANTTTSTTTSSTTPTIEPTTTTTTSSSSTTTTTAG